jgi:hypothetical protein
MEFFLFYADSLLGLFLVPEVGGDIFLRALIVFHRAARRYIAKDTNIFSN